MLDEQELRAYLIMSETMGDDELRSYLTKKEYRQVMKAKWKTKSHEEKREEILSGIGGLVIFTCSSLGAYSVSDGLQLLGVYDFVAAIIGAVLFLACATCLVAFPLGMKKKHQRQLDKDDYEYAQLQKATEEAVSQNSVVPLFPFCDPEWLKSLLETSPIWSRRKNSD